MLIKETDRLYTIIIDKNKSLWIQFILDSEETMLILTLYGDRCDLDSRVANVVADHDSL